MRTCSRLQIVMFVFTAVLNGLSLRTATAQGHFPSGASWQITVSGNGQFQVTQTDMSGKTTTSTVPWNSSGGSQIGWQMGAGGVYAKSCTVTFQGTITVTANWVTATGAPGPNPPPLFNLHLVCGSGASWNSVGSGSADDGLGDPVVTPCVTWDPAKIADEIELGWLGLSINYTYQVANNAGEQVNSFTLPPNTYTYLEIADDHMHYWGYGRTYDAGGYTGQANFDFKVPKGFEMRMHVPYLPVSGSSNGGGGGQP